MVQDRAEPQAGEERERGHTQHGEALGDADRPEREQEVIQRGVRPRAQDQATQAHHGAQRE